MKLLNLLLLLNLELFIACSGSKDSADSEDGEDVEMVDGEESFEDEDVEVVDSEEGMESDDSFDEGDELAEDDWDEEGDEVADDDSDWDEEDGDEVADSDEWDEELEDEVALAEEVGGDDVADLENAEAAAGSDSMGGDFEAIEGAPVADAAPASDVGYPENSYTDTSNVPVVGGMSGGAGDGSYVVQRNETLMLIAFKLYGDYTRWKEIASLNGLSASSIISPGQSLKYNTSGAGFSWSPQGNPYLIQRGDTLGIISDKVYNTTSRWKEIWNNNRPLIKDPNKIFAGFTIYYIPADGRKMASDVEETAIPEAAAPAAAPSETASDVPGSDDSFDDEFPDEL